MWKNIVLSFATVALSVASAASYKVTLFQPSEVNGKMLKAGNYKIEVVDNKAVLTSGKNVVEAPVKTETSDTKYSSTSVRLNTSHGSPAVQEIRIGGTNTKLVFSDTAVSQNR